MQESVIHIHIYIYIYTYIYVYIYIYRERERYSYIYIYITNSVREMGSDPRNPAPRNHLLVRIVKPSGRHCTDGRFTSRAFTEDRKIM